MAEELKQNPHAIFFTGTFTDDRIDYLCKKYGLEKQDTNNIATKEVRLFMERLRKANGGKSVKHWIVTEQGHTRTKRIHVHGIFFHKDKKFLLKILRENWIAGYKYNGEYVNEKTINYVVKYLTKTDLDNPDFRGKVLASPGLGSNYINSWDAKQCKYFPRTETAKTREEYRFKTGEKVPLPRYYKEKLFTEEERQLLWIEKMEEGYSFIMGEKIYTKPESDYITSEGQETYENLKKFYRELCIKVHKDNPNDWILKKKKRRLERERAKIPKMKEEIEDFHRKVLRAEAKRAKEREMQKRFDMDIERFTSCAVFT